ncbi:MAG: enoyl-CoA hydratase/isomerase family protein [Deltaproteobacteria bacterium]|nr:enoyl-CoA hydratase/isomerase family protein [Deltaproteobacteria bacterium]
MTLTHLEYEKLDGIALITLNRPEKLNVLSIPMAESFIQALQDAKGDAGIKAIVITGAGKAFCAGGDIQEMLDGKLKSWGMKRYLWEHLQKVPLLMEETDKLIVAAVNGAAAGGGFDLALACDVRAASPDATFISSYVRLGLAPGFGGCYFLPRIVGLGHALEILLSGKEVNAEEALDLGVVNRLYSKETLLEDTLAWAAEMTKWPLPSLKVIKRGVLQGLRSDLRSHLDYLSSQDALLSLTDEHQGILSRFQKK